MSRRVAVWIACDADGCSAKSGYVEDVVLLSVEPLRVEASRVGWCRPRVGMGYVDLCPEHVRREQ